MPSCDKSICWCCSAAIPIRAVEAVQRRGSGVVVPDQDVAPDGGGRIAPQPTSSWSWRDRAGVHAAGRWAAPARGPMRPSPATLCARPNEGIPALTRHAKCAGWKPPCCRSLWSGRRMIVPPVRPRRRIGRIPGCHPGCSTRRAVGPPRRGAGGRHGAGGEGPNRTAVPSLGTMRHAALFLLVAFGMRGCISRADDGLRWHTRITNAVRCVPAANLPEPAESTLQPLPARAGCRSCRRPGARRSARRGAEGLGIPPSRIKSPWRDPRTAGRIAAGQQLPCLHATTPRHTRLTTECSNGRPIVQNV